jgi:hypothetical protein
MMEVQPLANAGHFAPGTSAYANAWLHVDEVKFATHNLGIPLNSLGHHCDFKSMSDVICAISDLLVCPFEFKKFEEILPIKKMATTTATNIIKTTTTNFWRKKRVESSSRREIGSATT